MGVWISKSISPLKLCNDMVGKSLHLTISIFLSEVNRMKTQESDELRRKEVRYTNNIYLGLSLLSIVILLVNWESIYSLVDKIFSVIPLP